MRLSIIVFSLFFLLLSCDRKNELSLIPVKDINPESRKVISMDMETYDLGGGLLSPGYFDVDNNVIYVADFKDHGIYRGNLVTEVVELNKIAGRKGSGPGEFEDISDIQVLNNSILISDENRARLNKFSLEGEFEKSYAGKNFQIHRFVALNLNHVITLSFLKGEYVIKVIDTEKDYVKQNFLKKDNDLSPIVYEGKIAANKNGEIFYSGFSEPVLIKFSEDEEKQFSVDHVDSYSSLTNYIKMDTGNGFSSYRYSPTAEFYTISSAYFNDMVCILVKRGEDKYVDFYNSDNGKYQYSIEVSSKAIELDVDEGDLFILNLTIQNTSLDRISF